MSAPPGPLRIGYVDDHEMVRDLVCDMLEATGLFKVVVRAKHGVEYAERCREVGHVQVTLVDLLMPLRDGFDTMLWMRTEQPRTKPLAITFDALDHYVERALECGACGVLQKDVDKSVLVQALQDVHQRGFHYNEFVDRKLRNRLREAEAQTPADKLARLSERELLFFRYWVDPEWRSMKEVAAAMGVSEHTTDGYRKSIADKTECRERHAMVDLARACGIRSLRVPKADARSGSLAAFFRKRPTKV